MRRAFTLIEMLVVIGVLAILAGAVVAVGGMVKAGAQRRTTLATLKACEGLMRDYLAAGNPEPQGGTVSTWFFGAPFNGKYTNKWFQPNWNAPPPESLMPMDGSDVFNWTLALSSYPPTAKALLSLPHGPVADEVVHATNVPNPTGSGLDRVNPDGHSPTQLFLNAWNAESAPQASPAQGKMSDWPEAVRRGTRFIETMDANGKTYTNDQGQPAPIYHFPKFDYMVILDAWGNPIRFMPSQTDGSGNVTKPFYFMSAGPDGTFFSRWNNGVYGSNPQPTKNDDLFSTDQH